MNHACRMAILVHIDPDLDAIGSALLEKEVALSNGYKEVLIVGKLNYYYKWLIDEGDVVEDIPEDWDKYQVTVVDAGSPSSLNAKQKKILKKATVVTVYDHHMPENREEWLEAIDAKDNFDYSWYPKHDSCCQLLVDMFLDSYKCGDPSLDISGKLSKKTLTALLAGIYAESNSLRDCSDETLKVVAKLIILGGDMSKVVKNCNKSVATWKKMEYMAKVIGRRQIYAKEGIIAMASTYSEYCQSNFNATRARGMRKAPIYILSLLRRENIKFKHNMNAYMLFYNREDGNKKSWTMVVELIRWSKARQEALAALGFKVARLRQYRYYLNVDAATGEIMSKNVADALMSTDSDDLEEV